LKTNILVLVITVVLAVTTMAFIMLKYRLLYWASLFVCKIVYGVIAPGLQKLFHFLYQPKSLTTNECVVYSIVQNWKEYTDFGFEANNPCCFLLKYNRVELVEYCQSVDVWLYHVDIEYFYFVKMPIGMEISNIEKHPFQATSLHDHAIELIKVQHGVVHDYLKTIGGDHDGTNLTILYSTGRCGSTITAAMLYKTGQAVVYAEHGVLYAFLFLHRDNKIPLTSSVTHDIAADMLRLMSPDVTKTYVIKAKPYPLPISVLKAALPGIREVFLYRNLRSNAQSWKNIAFPARSK